MPALVPLTCPRCQAGLDAEPEQVVFLCPTCSGAWQLDDSPESPARLLPLTLRYAPELRGSLGRPFWVASGQVQTGQREVHGWGSQERAAVEHWATPRRFFVPAFKCDLNSTLELGRRLLTEAPKPPAGAQAPFVPVVVTARNLRGLAEFVIISIEAERGDNLKTLRFSLELGEPELWILP
ncbi:MAG TPA: hypothetical protein PK954_05225 [Anaerolineales bacterium]|nr:hypothetical protein [Anaerolineales bacterium]HRF49974.1 hypothetical protein [Anaerolineales bacterium]